ncbi:hypothetical protein C8J57DRAFT_1298020, partial [Mycena rebaudengoi]
MLQFCAKRFPCRTVLSSQPGVRIRFAPQANRFFCRTALVESPKHRPKPSQKLKTPGPARAQAIPPSSPHLAAETALPGQSVNPPDPSIRNHVLFAGFVSCSVFLWAAAQTNIDTDVWVQKLTVLGISPNNLDIRRAKAWELRERVRRWIAGLDEQIQNFPPVVEATLRDAYVYVANGWINASPAQRLCWGMVTFNGAVFIGWKIHRLTPFMMNNFLHYPLSGKTRTLLTSVFSHSEFFHFAFNNMALASGFGVLAAAYLSNQQAKGSSGRLESTNAYHLFALYISAGLFSSLVAHAYRIRIYKALTATMVKAGQASAIPAVTIMPSLGASGALYSLITVCALSSPDVSVNAMLIPINIPIQYAVCGLVTLDMIGLARKWRRFDHAAHLGGALFGVLYYMYGPKIWDFLRG